MSAGGAAAAIMHAGEAPHRPDVDGMRAVAVAGVIIWHLDAGRGHLPGGFTGVEMFFVISGYVVAGSLLRDRAKSPAAFLGGFYTKRVKRLTPSLVAVIALVATLFAWLVPPFKPD